MGEGTQLKIFASCHVITRRHGFEHLGIILDFDRMFLGDLVMFYLSGTQKYFRDYCSKYGQEPCVIPLNATILAKILS